jgi:hypothetical protein
VLARDHGERRPPANDDEGDAHDPNCRRLSAARDFSLFVISKRSVRCHADGHLQWAFRTRKLEAFGRIGCCKVDQPFFKEKLTMPQSSQQSRKGAARQQSISEPALKAAAKPTEDHVYGLVSVLYHALQGAQTYGQYIQDAKTADDEELVKFFEQCRAEETERAARAKQLLVDRTELEEDDDEAEDEEDDEDDEE